MTNPFVVFPSGTMYASGPKTQPFPITASAERYWAAADSAKIETVIEDVINYGTVVLSGNLGSVSGAFSSTIGALSSAFSSTIGALATSSVDSLAKTTATLALYDASNAQETADSALSGVVALSATVAVLVTSSVDAQARSDAYQAQLTATQALYDASAAMLTASTLSILSGNLNSSASIWNGNFNHLLTSGVLAPSTLYFTDTGTGLTVSVQVTNGVVVVQSA